MKFLNSGIMSCCLLLAVIQLAGCATDAEVSANYQFNPQSNNGLVAFTTACNLGNFDPTVFIMQADSGGQAETLVDSYAFNIHCNSSDAGLNNPQLKVLSLPDGHYYIDKIYKLLVNGTETITFSPIYFNVYHGQINYLGRLQLIYGYNDLVEVKVTNESGSDLPLLKEHISNYNDSYLIQGLLRQKN